MATDRVRYTHGVAILEYADPSVATRRFTTDDVRRMVEAGILAEGENIELLDGQLVLMSPQGPRHRGGIAQLAKLLRAAYGDAFEVAVQMPLDAGEASQPEPDLAVIPARDEGWWDRHPRGDEAVLVVEVAETSQRVDRAKAAIYARAGVASYWLLDLSSKQLETLSRPQKNGEYGERRVLAEADYATFPGLERGIAVARLVGPKR